MISFRFNHDNKNIKTIEVLGHSSVSHGNDIVCASVSTAIIVTINAIEKLGLIEQVSYQLEEGLFRLSAKSTDKALNSLLENLEYTLKELKKQYPTKIRNKE